MSWTPSPRSAPEDERREKRVVLDTNVLIAATFWDGIPRKLIRSVEEHRFVLVLSEYLLQEYRETLETSHIQDKVRKNGLLLRLTEAHIRNLSDIVEERTPVDIVADDPDDNHVLACALDGAVTHLVTRDHDLLRIGVWQGIRIMTPEEFFENL